MAPRLRRFSDARAFSAAATPFLVEHEAENCLLLGIAGTLARGGSPYTGDNFLAVVEDDDGVHAAAFMTPPHGPVISRIGDPAIVDLLIAALLPRQNEVSTVLGPAETAERFGVRWERETGRTAELELRERSHQLERVIPPKPASGSWRHATTEDFDLLVSLVRAFNLQAFGAPAAQVGREKIYVAARLNAEWSGYAFWKDGAVVALAGYGNATPNGVFIGPVYTPPEFRGRGYATALTAALSQDLLDRGRSKVFLFTNLSNAIANHVYKKIGYEPVIDVDQWKFSEPD